jgi:hypothetical protein
MYETYFPEKWRTQFTTMRFFPHRRQSKAAAGNGGKWYCEILFVRKTRMY